MKPHSSSNSAFVGSLFVVVAPSGAGKTSLVRELLNNHPALNLSVSYTTRDPRQGEVDGVDYIFISRNEFESRREAGEFVEWAQVHGNLYGTSETWLAARTQAGVDVLLEIDWQGALQVKQRFPDSVGVFIAPPSVEELRARLLRRGQDSNEVIDQRVKAAERELAQAHRFEYVIINQDFASAARDLSAIVEAARTRFRQQSVRHQGLFASLGMAKPLI